MLAMNHEANLLNERAEKSAPKKGISTCKAGRCSETFADRWLNIGHLVNARKTNNEAVYIPPPTCSSLPLLVIMGKFHRNDEATRKMKA